MILTKAEIEENEKDFLFVYFYLIIIFLLFNYLLYKTRINLITFNARFLKQINPC